MNTKILSAVAISALLAFGASAQAASNSSDSSNSFTTVLDGKATITVHQNAQTQLVIGSNNHVSQSAGTIFAGVHIKGDVNIAVDQNAQTQLVIGSNNTVRQHAGSVGPSDN